MIVGLSAPDGAAPDIARTISAPRPGWEYDLRTRADELAVSRDIVDVWGPVVSRVVGITALVGLAVVAAACGTASSGELGRDGATDSERDAGVGDAGTTDAGVVDCAAWCRLELDCRVEVVTERDVFGSALDCHYPAPDDALARCVDVCTGGGANILPGLSEECLICEAGNLRLSCMPDRRWRNCRTVCEYDLGFIREALIDALSCAPEEVPTPAPLCTGSAGDGLRIAASTATRELEVRSSATVVGRAPLTFGLPDGIEVEVEAYGSVVLPALSLGESVELDVAIDCPFWCESTVIVRDGGGGLVLAAWSGDRWRTPALPELGLDYAASECAWSRRECYAALSGDLIATPRGGAPVRVRPQSASTIEGLRVHHVGAEAFYEHACTDTPWERTMGLVAGRE